MFERGKLVNDYFTKEKLIYMEVNESLNNTNENILNNVSKSKDNSQIKGKNKKMHILIPKRSNLINRLKTKDDTFNDFIRSCLQIDPKKR